MAIVLGTTTMDQLGEREVAGAEVEVVEVSAEELARHQAQEQLQVSAELGADKKDHFVWYAQAVKAL